MSSDAAGLQRECRTLDNTEDADGPQGHLHVLCITAHECKIMQCG